MTTMVFAEGATNDHPFYRKAAVMTPLQEQVVKLGLCPNCHAKTLWQSYAGGGMSFNNCEKCSHTWVLSTEVKTND